MLDGFTCVLAQEEGLVSSAFMELFSAPWFFWVVVFVGACVGSFLNVVIYRVPLGLNINDPKRSYCPGCKAPIPWWRNIPVITWVIQRGRCAGCDGKIPVRYLLVEVMTAALFGAVWQAFPPGEAFLGFILVSLLVAISFIDAEHYVINVRWCYLGILIALVGSHFFSGLVKPTSAETFVFTDVFKSGAWHSFLGAGVGYFSLVAIVLFGKMAFGKKKKVLESPEKWYLKEPQSEDEQLQFVLGKEPLDWGEVFYRKTDRIELMGSDFKIDGKGVEGSSLILREREVEISGEVYQIEEMKSLEGKATEVVIPREAMGGGDPPFLGMIGAFLGAPAVLFTIFASSFFAIIAAILGRVGFGKPLPFGPFLALGGLSWMFGGDDLFKWYLDLLGG